MKKNLRNLLILALVLAVLGGVAAAVAFWPQAGEAQEDPVSSQTASLPEKEALFQHGAGDVEAILVKNPNGEYRMLGQQGANGVVFTLEGYDDYNLLESSIGTAAESLFSASTARELGEIANLADFGLKGADAAEVEITYTDGTGDTLVLGNEAAETSGRYVLKDGKVYILSGVSSLLYGAPTAFISTSLYTISDRVLSEEQQAAGATAYDLMSSIRFTGTNFPEPITVKWDEGMLSEYRITEPVSAESGNTAFLEMIDGMKSLTASKVMAVGITDELLAEYGLDEPFAQVEFTLNGQTHTLAVSAAADGYRNLLCDNNDVIYQVAKDTVACWAEQSLGALRMSYVMVAQADNVQRLTVTANGKTHVFDVTRTVNEETSTETTTNYDLAVTEEGGGEIDADEYRHFYSQAMAIPALNSEQTEYDEKAVVLSLRYEYFDNTAPDEVLFCEAGTDRYAALLNGDYNGQMRTADVDKVVRYLDALLNGEDLPSLF